ncbi:MAG: N-acetylneuraminate synthase family protein [Proteobacteria bacterium]|nr:N-acetylneuraminate synthase family protein [Pseudomonadota bacterium]
MGVFIIAEIGINHNGSLEIAKQLIDMAKESGCDAVKFQKRTIDIVYTAEMLAQPRKSPWGETQREQKEGLEFGRAEYDEIDAYCKAAGISWFASAWDVESQKFLQTYNLPYNKIASAMLTHLPLLEMVAEEGKPTFISTGMSTFEQIDEALEIFRRAGCPFTLMHCVSTYPSQDEDCNVSMVRTLKERYGCSVGYSGHELGILPSVLSVAVGAEVVERHITLDRAMYGSDQSASLEKRGLDLLVRDCRLVGVVLGDGAKKLLDAEMEVEKKLRYFREP